MKLSTAALMVGSTALGLVSIGGSAMATPITTLTPLTSNGMNVNAVYLFSLAADTLNLSEIGPNSVSNIFCNYSNNGCTAATSGQIVSLGNPGPGLVFGLTDLTVPNLYRTDSLGSDGYAHDIVSPTVDASDAAAVNAAYETLGFGQIDPLYATPIAFLGQTPGTVVTFVQWEDRIGGDYDYNDFVFALTDPPPATDVPEPLTLVMFGVGLAAIGGIRRRVRKA